MPCVALRAACVALIAALTPDLCLAQGPAELSPGDGGLRVIATRDLSFGRVVAEGAGAMRVSAASFPSVENAGRAAAISGGLRSSARFVVEGIGGTTDGTIVLITLPQSFQMRAGGRTLLVDDVRAEPDDAGRNWTDLGGGRFLCTLSHGGRCAFVIGARLRLPSGEAAGEGRGRFSVAAEIFAPDGGGR